MQMFTGIIEEIGLIQSISPIPGGKKINIKADVVLEDLKIDQSVCVNGVCLTVVGISGNVFSAEAVGETLEKSTLQSIKNSTPVNLERAMKLDDRLGGHLVQGHVNGLGRISKLIKRGDNWYLEVELSDDLMRYVVPEGSIAIDGISLTVANLNRGSIGISVIPHTFKNTNLSQIKVGQKCNIETDLIGKYLEKWFKYSSDYKESKPITVNWLKNQGY
jgi:riboflavin synthase